MAATCLVILGMALYDTETAAQMQACMHYKQCDSKGARTYRPGCECTCEWQEQELWLHVSRLYVTYQCSTNHNPAALYMH